MSKKQQNTEAIREYGVEEMVPAEGRHYSFLDMTGTWIGANAQPNTWWLGGVIAAGGFVMALGTTLIANPLVFALLAVVGLMGFKIGTTSMGLMRFPLGIRGSKVVALVNIITLIGWGAVGNFIGATSMSYLLYDLFGMPCYGMDGSTGTMVLGVMINAVLSCLFVWIGGAKSVKVAETVACVAMIILSIWVTIRVFQVFPLSEIVSWEPTDDVRLPIGAGIDVVVGFSLSWIPTVADYTRYTKSKKAATIAPLIGACIGIFWFCLVGTVTTIASALTTGAYDVYANDPSSVAASLGLGIPAILIVILSTVTTNMISIYSSGISTLNLFDKPKDPKKVSYVVGGITILLSLIPVIMGSFMDFFYSFLDILALLFPGLIAIVVLDYFVLRKQKYNAAEIGNKSGPYWYSGGFNIYAFASWIIGIITFIIFKNIPAVSNSISAVVPTFFVTGIVYLILGKIAMNKGYYKE